MTEQGKCAECVADHLQLASWLEELQALRRDCPADCYWKQIGRYQKCTSCARNKYHPDNYRPGTKEES